MTKKIRCYETFEFSDLPKHIKKRILINLYDLNVSDQWWDTIYEDAANIGLTLTGFDIGRGQECTGRFTIYALDCAKRIQKEHGDGCDTLKSANAFLFNRALEMDARNKKTGQHYEDSYVRLDELDAAFLKSVLRDYLKMLRDEYDYLSSDEAIIETIEANDFEFDEKGNIVPEHHKKDLKP